MRASPLGLLRIALLAASLSAVRAAEPPALGWPEITRENKPWTRWWWPGSAVDPAGLTRQLEQIAAAGFGGVEITPIYGAKGYEDRYLDFLSPRWMEMLAHAGREARRLGLGVDLATGTGWPFGGPWVTPADGAQKPLLRDGAIAFEPTKMVVKRAAPGGEGLVVDPYSPDALQRYLAPFGTAFQKFPRDLVRGQFHDSFEYYGAAWTARLPEVFRAMHGYDIGRFAAELLAKNPDEVKTIDRDTLARIKADYRATLAHLHLEYLQAWAKWSHERGWIIRNQSHGAPANLLDLYGSADIPETEVFGSTPFPIPGLRRAAEEVRHDQDLPNSLVIRLATSAAHVMGRRYVSSETATWLREHWKESPSAVKPELDRLFTEGINHVFYHGTVYSPADVAWPGWLFYASTQFNPNNPLWDDLAALNRYVARVQSFLQRGQPDHDVLLYWPVADIWHDAGGLMKQLGVHDVTWLTEQPVGKLARQLHERGIGFDFISDAQLAQTQSVGSAAAGRSALKTPGALYPPWTTVLVPPVRYMPVMTLQHLFRLAATHQVVFVGDLPTDVPGYGRLEERRGKLRAELNRVDLRPMGNVRQGYLETHEHIELWPESDLAALLGARGDPLAETGLSFTRRRQESGTVYLVANLTAQPFEGWARLQRSPPQASSPAVAFLDPLSGRTGLAASKLERIGERTVLGIYLQLQPGESLVLQTFDQQPPRGPAWPYRRPAGAAMPLAGTWKIEFTQGGPELPPAVETAELKSWTELGGAAAQRFAGTARYRLEFDAPAAKADDWLLDLGDVRETARVRLNGRDVATAWSVPFQVRIGDHLRPGRNTLEIDVTNLAANRVRDLDRRNVDWKIMREINFVNINYQPFDASQWPLTSSGLLGPIRLVPLAAFNP